MRCALLPCLRIPQDFRARRNLWVEVDPFGLPDELRKTGEPGSKFGELPSILAPYAAGQGIDLGDENRPGLLRRRGTVLQRGLLFSVGWLLLR